MGPDVEQALRVWECTFISVTLTTVAELKGIHYLKSSMSLRFVRKII
jgi:hypothetical protein